MITVVTESLYAFSIFPNTMRFIIKVDKVIPIKQMRQKYFTLFFELNDTVLHICEKYVITLLSISGVNSLFSNNCK